MFNNFKYKNTTYSLMAVLSIITAIIFLVACLFGEGLGGSLGLNQTCLKYLGCSVGFFGYDAIEHFLFGISAAFILVWFFQKFPKYSLLNTKHWKNVLTIVVLIVFISVIWEFIEFIHDIFRSDFLNQILLNQKLHINLLDQPNNTDTMGDLFFSLCGSLLSLFFMKFSNTKL